MNYIKISLLFCFCLVGLWGCEEATETETPSESVFAFAITGTNSGKIKSVKGTVKATCEGNRTLLTFSEGFNERTEKDDLLIGELILGIQKTDTTGVFKLNGISNERHPKEVGIVALLNTLTFDELAAQYITNEKRYDDVRAGKVTITKWSRAEGGIITGGIIATLGRLEEEVSIKGNFTVKLQGGDDVCTKE